MSAAERQGDVDSLRPYRGRHEAPPCPLTTDHETVMARAREAIARPLYRAPQHEATP